MLPSIDAFEYMGLFKVQDLVQQLTAANCRLDLYFDNTSTQRGS